MVSHNISLNDNAYQILKKWKGDRSFSEAVLDLVPKKMVTEDREERKKRLMAMFGVWKDIPDDEWAAFEEERRHLRSTWRTDQR